LTSRDALLCAGFSLALPIGQLMFKWAAIQHERQAGPLLARVATNIPLLAALAWYGLTAVFWFYILTRVPLSRAYPFALAGTGLIPIIAWFVFREPMGWRIAAGYVLMLAGLFVIQSQSS
jgi:multidrug transporter EmrE-like cation transporter